jgi:hypothetical protein
MRGLEAQPVDVVARRGLQLGPQIPPLPFLATAAFPAARETQLILAIPIVGDLAKHGQLRAEVRYGAGERDAETPR